MNEFYKSKLYKEYEDAIDEEESYTVWYNEEIIKQLENIKKCLKKARPKDYNNRGHQDELSINLEVIDKVINLLEKYCFKKGVT